MEFTTSIRTKIHETPLRWNIVNYCEYEECGIRELSTPKIEIKGTNVTVKLTIFPRKEDAELELDVEDPDDAGNHLFTAHITTELEGTKLNSPGNRNAFKSHGFYSDPIEVKPDQWDIVSQKFNYKKFNARTNFIHNVHPEYLNSGTLVLNCKFSIKTVDICNEAKHFSN